MRRRIACYVLVPSLVCCAVNALAESRYETNGPEQARVVTAGAAVRSGPAANSYLTDTLAEGAVVEVYHRRPDGWCAIRPPAGSFSWVFAQHLRLSGNELATINKDDVPSRVGSRLSASRDIVQVRLKQGETVRVLDKEQDGSGEVWYKIAPPAGEFRWIEAENIVPIEAGSDRPPRDDRVTTAALEEPLSNPTAELTAPPLGAGAPTNSVIAVAPLPQPKEKAVESAATDITPVAAASTASPDLAKELNSLELRLSRMVSESPATWSVDALQQSAEQLLARADSVGDRAAVKCTLEKIDRFAAIQRRYQNLNVTTPVIAGAPKQGQATTSNNQGTTTAGGPFDAAGILRPVVSRRPGAPQFALVNDQGQVVTFITPSPDVNLQPYVGRRVAVSGNRGYIPEFHRAHVTASRVTPLGDRIVR